MMQPQVRNIARTAPAYATQGTRLAELAVGVRAAFARHAGQQGVEVVPPMVESAVHLVQPSQHGLRVLLQQACKEAATHVRTQT